MNTPDFDETTHTYTVDGVVYPGVTTILDEAGFIDARWWKPEDAMRGKRVHTITALYDKGELDDAKVANDLRGYLESWKAYLGLRGKMTASVIDIKTGAPLAWHGLQLAAYLILAKLTPHILGGPETIEARLYDPVFRFAGTVDRINMTRLGRVFCECVYLDADGKPPRVVHPTDFSEHNAFLGALSVYSWKMRRGLLRKDEDDNSTSDA